MLFSIISCCFSSLFCYVLCEGDYSFEYKNTKEMYKKQQAPNSRVSFGLREHEKNETYSKYPKESTTMNEYSYSSEGWKTLDNENYDGNLEEIREKAKQKYTHPDDQELYLAARTYTPTIASWEISSLIHSVNSQYKHILSSNDSITTTKIVRAKTTVTTKPGRPRFTIFREKHIRPSLDYNKIQSVAKNNTDVKENHSVSHENIHETKSIQQNNQYKVDMENHHSFKSVEDPESFKSFLLEQGKKGSNPLNKFIDAIDEQNMHIPELSVTTEDPVFNSSNYKYIENQIDDFEERNRRHFLSVKGITIPERITVIDEKKEALYDNLFNKQIFKNSAELLGGFVDKLDVSPDIRHQVQHTEKAHDDYKENVKLVQQTERNVHRPERRTELDYKSEYYENDVRAIQSKEATAFDKSQFYRFAQDAQNKEDAYEQSEFDRPGDVQNIPLRHVHIEDKDKCDPNETSTLSGHPKRLDKTKGNKTLIIAKQGCPSCSNKTSHVHYQQQPRQGYRKRPWRRHHHHHKRHHHHHHNQRKYRGPYNPYMPKGPYMPPFLYNQYCPPPFPYPPQYYQQPQNHPHFYHFTTPHPDHLIPVNQMGVHASSMEQTTPGKTEDQYDLYLKLKDIFKPVENALQGVSIGSPPFYETKMTTTTKSTPGTPQSTAGKRYAVTPILMAQGTMQADDRQKCMENHFNLPPTQSVNSVTDNSCRARIGDYLPKDIVQGQKDFYTGCTRGILDHNPDCPEAAALPRKYTRRQRHHRKHRGPRNRHQHCCCHHHHRRKPQRPRKSYPRKRYSSGVIVEEIDSKNIPPENNAE